MHGRHSATLLSRLRLPVPHPVSTAPLARTPWHLDLRRGAWEQLVVSGTVGTTDGMVCGVLGTESTDAQGADPRTWDFVECFFPAREAAPRPSGERSEREGTQTVTS